MSHKHRKLSPKQRDRKRRRRFVRVEDTTSESTPPPSTACVTINELRNVPCAHDPERHIVDQGAPRGFGRCRDCGCVGYCPPPAGWMHTRTLEKSGEGRATVNRWRR